MAVTGISGGVPLLDFSELADIGKNYKASQVQKTREMSLAALKQGASIDDVANSLLAAGDMEGGLSLAKLGISQKVAQSGASGVYGTPIYGQDENGKTVLGAIGKNGRFVPIDTGGVTVNPGIKTIDTGTGTMIIDARSGRPMSGGSSGGQPGAPQAPQTNGGYVPKDVAGESAARTEGAEAGKATFSLPQTLSKADQSIAVIDRMIKHPGRATATGLSGTLDPRNYIPGTSAKDFRVGIDQLKGQAFLQAFESLKGGGQITEVEGQKATAAMARLDTAQSDGKFKAALVELRGILANGKQRAIQMARQRQQGAPQAARPQQSGPVRVNTPDEARRLPSGTEIILPDGTPGRVP